MEVRIPSKPKPAAQFVRQSSKEAAEANRQERDAEEPGVRIPSKPKPAIRQSSKEAVDANRQERDAEEPGVRIPSKPKPAVQFVRQSSREAVEANRQEPDTEALRKSSEEAAEANRQERNIEASPQTSQSLTSKDGALPQKLPSLINNNEPLSPRSPSLPWKTQSLKSPATKKKAVPNAMRKEIADAKQQELSQLLSQEQVSWNMLEKRFAKCKHILNPNITDPEAKITTLHRAAFDGVASCVKWCIDARADVGASTTAGKAPLHYACEANSAECVELLVRCQADPNQTTLGGATPLHVACMNGYSEALQALLYTALDIDVNVDLEVEDMRRQTPEMHAKKNPALLEIIRQYLVDAETKRLQRIAVAAAMAFSASLAEAQLPVVFRAWAKEAKKQAKVNSEAKLSLKSEGGADEHPSVLEDEQAKASEENPSEKSSGDSPRKSYVPAYALALGLG